jgi:predicted ATPase
MFIKHIQARGILSFGPDGIDLPLENLNVLIGPNGSGKSNLLELFALLKAAPAHVARLIRDLGGVREWLWKTESGGHLNEGTLSVVVESVITGTDTGLVDLRHVLSIAEHGGRFEVVNERIEEASPRAGETSPSVHYDFRRGNPLLADRTAARMRELEQGTIQPDASILSQYRDPGSYPALASLQELYPRIYLFRNWSFGPNAVLRREQGTHIPGNFLADGGDNLVLVLANLLNSKSKKQFKEELIDSLNKLYDGIEDVNFSIESGTMQLRLEESGSREIPASRLSDGTLRYLCLLSILLHPDPPPLIAIEEPELGLHPDVIPHLVDLMRRCAERTQLVVTTHSRMLVDALVESPEAVIVCEKHDGQSSFERLEPERLSAWLKRYSLGQLWNMGEIGGNPW